MRGAAREEEEQGMQGSLWYQRVGSALIASALAMGPAWADEPDSAALRADIEVLKSKLARLESQVANGQATVGIAEKPLPGAIQLPSGLGDLNFSGYADISYVYNFAEGDAGVGRTNRGRAFDTESNGFTPHAFELVVERPADDAMPIGFRTDLFFGDDAEVFHSTGAGTATDQFDLQQLYITSRIPLVEGLEVKAGKFVTLLGAEVIESPANWNFSRSYMFTYSIPFTHTGALATYALPEGLGSVTGGVVNGWDVVDDNNKGKTFLGNITITPIEDLSLSSNLVTGPEQGADNRDDRTVISNIATWKPIDELTLMANYDFGHESGVAPLVGTAGGTAGFDSAEWTGMALYAKYDLSPTWALAGRLEWFDDKSGVRTGFGGPDGGILNDVDYYGYTLTSSWTLYEHVLARLFYRRASLGPLQPHGVPLA
jgi:hypothetical protein